MAISSGSGCASKRRRNVLELIHERITVTSCGEKVRGGSETWPATAETMSKTSPVSTLRRRAAQRQMRLGWGAGWWLRRRQFTDSMGPLSCQHVYSASAAHFRSRLNAAELATAFLWRRAAAAQARLWAQAVPNTRAEAAQCTRGHMLQSQPAEPHSHMRRVIQAANAAAQREGALGQEQSAHHEA